MGRCGLILRVISIVAEKNMERVLVLFKKILLILRVEAIKNPWLMGKIFRREHIVSQNCGIQVG